VSKTMATRWQQGNNRINLCTLADKISHPRSQQLNLLT